jgi:glycosyltransferase involved in cell wall biosynthesis
MLGHLDKETLSNYYANADVFIHPNPKEPFGIAPLEVMASGVPTVAPRAGGILSYATDKNAWLVEPNAQEFAAAIRDAGGNSERKLLRVKNAVETARANTREASTDRLFATYDEIYEDFQNRKELFIDGDDVKTFDYSKLIHD